MNLRRAELRRAAGTLLAVRDALSVGGIGPDWFDALAETPDEAKAAHAEYEAQRQLNETT